MAVREKLICREAKCGEKSTKEMPIYHIQCSCGGYAHLYGTGPKEYAWCCSMCGSVFRTPKEKK